MGAHDYDYEPGAGQVGKAAPTDWARLRDVPIDGEEALSSWMYLFTGIRPTEHAVCRDHSSQLEALSAVAFDRAPIVTIVGSRGSGKSAVVQAGGTHLKCRSRPGYAASILGGSEKQSMQVYSSIHDNFYMGLGASGTGDESAFEVVLKKSAVYRNRSLISILAASQKSIRGPHVPQFDLDELDEIDPDLLGHAAGIAQARGDWPSQTVMTSTWHKLGGNVGKQLEWAKANNHPIYILCVFDVLEECPEWRSGPRLEKCPACPLVKWCHADREGHGRGVPKAKRARGYYKIDDLIAKLALTSAPVFAADYLCAGPRAEGLWFAFDAERHVFPSLAYHPGLPLYCGVDTGVFTAAVWFQVYTQPGAVISYYPPVRTAPREYVAVLAEYLAENVSSHDNAMAMRRIGESLFGRHFGPPWDLAWYDPSGGARLASGGPTVIATFREAGLGDKRVFRPWKQQGKFEKLDLLGSFVSPADDKISLVVHPRCKHTIAAFGGFRRKKRGGVYQDYPEEVHPHEDMIDALAGGLDGKFPGGRGQQETLLQVDPSWVA